MTKLLAAAAALLMTTTAANAAVTVTTSTNFAVPNPLLDFDSPTAAGVIVHGRIANGDGLPQYRSPDATAANYLVGEVGSPAAISGLNTNFLSFYWGSIDTYNTLSLFDTLGRAIFSYTGQDYANQFGAVDFGYQGARVDFTSDTKIGTVLFRTTKPAFEVDNVSVSPVPEPATWLLMFTGFAAVAATARYRRANMRVTYA